MYPARRIAEHLAPYSDHSEYKSGGTPDMGRISQALESNPHTKHFNTRYPMGHPKHHGRF